MSLVIGGICGCPAGWTREDQPDWPRLNLHFNFIFSLDPEQPISSSKNCSGMEDLLRGVFAWCWIVCIWQAWQQNPEVPVSHGRVHSLGTYVWLEGGETSFIHTAWRLWHLFHSWAFWILPEIHSQRYAGIAIPLTDHTRMSAPTRVH